jgi:hypothetical protein
MVRPPPALLFFGNCQAQFLAAAVKYSGAAEAYYVGEDWGFLHSYRGCVVDLLAQDIVPEWVFEKRRAGQQVLLAAQVGPMVNSRFAMKIDPGIADSQALFPNTSLWPMSRERFIEKFKAPYPIERLEEINRESNEAAQAKSDFPVDVARFIAEESSRRSIFSSGAHPTGKVYSLLLRGLSKRLASELDSTALQRLADDCVDEQILNFTTDHPVDASVRQTLGWNWGPEYEIFAEMLRATKDARWDDLQRKRACYETLFAANTQFWRSYALLGIARRSDEIALPALERLLELCPGAPGPWLLSARYYVRTRRAAKAAALIGRAHAFFGNTTAFSTLSEKISKMLASSMV